MIHKKFNEVWETEPTFTAEYKASAFYLSEIVDAKITLIYYLLYARYGNSTIASHDEDQFKAKVFLTMYQYAPLWIKRSAMQAAVRAMSIEDAQEGATSIYNHAENPETSPAVDSFDALPYINDQTANKQKKSAPAAIATILELLSTDYTEDFINKFKKLFMTIIPGNICELPDPGPSVVEGINVKSTGASAGKVLTADGDGGASWEDAPLVPQGTLTAGGLLVGLGSNVVSSFHGTPGKILKAGNDGTVIWGDSYVEKTEVPGEVAINDGMTVNENGDAEVGRDLLVDGDANIHENLYIAGIFFSGNEMRLTGQGFRQLKDASNNLLKLGTDQIDADGVSAGKVLTADGDGVASWETPTVKHLYQHNIYCFGPFTGWASFQLFNNSDSNIGWNGVSNWLKENGYTAVNAVLPCTGIINNKAVVACYNGNPGTNNYIYFILADGSTYNTNAASANEKIIQII